MAITQGTKEITTLHIDLAGIFRLFRMAKYYHMSLLYWLYLLMGRLYSRYMRAYAERAHFLRVNKQHEY